MAGTDQEGQAMNTHLQECIYTPENIDHDKGIRWGGSPCICDELRACEQRMLDAAREAVAGVGVRKDTSHDMRVQALAAIDALREEKK